MEIAFLGAERSRCPDRGGCSTFGSAEQTGLLRLPLMENKEQSPGAEAVLGRGGAQRVLVCSLPTVNPGESLLQRDVVPAQRGAGLCSHPPAGFMLQHPGVKSFSGLNFK